MLKKRDSVDRLRVASPCPMNWEQMTGDERTRFCDRCNLHVYNISEMTRREVESLVTDTEGRICGRLYRRADGTVLTKDCPVGLSAIRRRVSKVAGAAITAIFSLCVSAFGQKPVQEDKSPATGFEQVQITRASKDKAQQNRAVVSGVVKDPNGAVVAGAALMLINQKTKQKIETTSNDEGVFKFDSLEPGIYNLETFAVGFQARIVENIEIQVAEAYNIVLPLNNVASSSQVFVGLIGIDYEFTPEPSAAAGLRTTFSSKKITSLPF